MWFRRYPRGQKHTYTHRDVLITILRKLVSWSLASLFSTNMTISETKGQGWRAIPTRWKKASDILTSTLAAFLVSSHRKRKRIKRLIMACTIVQAVVKATSQSNGKGQILTPRGSETPERISMKLGIYNRVAGMTTHANPCGAATTWVVWANTWKNTCCGILGIPFFFTLFFSSRRARTRGPILTIYTSYDVFPPKDVPFVGLVHTVPHFGGKIPQKPQFWGRE